MFRQETVWCPVGQHVALGIRNKGQSGTFVCRECGFIFPVDKDGKFGKPVSIKDAKKAAHPIRYCGPGDCVCHD